MTNKIKEIETYIRDSIKKSLNSNDEKVMTEKFREYFDNLILRNIDYELIVNDKNIEIVSNNEFTNIVLDYFKKLS